MQNNSPSKLRRTRQARLKVEESRDASRWNQRWVFANGLLTLVILAAGTFFTFQQSVRSEQQNRIAESTRRAGQLAEVVASFDAVQHEQDKYCDIHKGSDLCIGMEVTVVDKQPMQAAAVPASERSFRLSTTVNARLVALTMALKPYQYFQFHEVNPTTWDRKELNCTSALVDNLSMKDFGSAAGAITRANDEILAKAPLANQFVERPYSPERAQVLQFLSQANVDLAPLISGGADFSNVLMDDTHLDGLVMPDANLSSSRFVGASLRRAHLSHTSLDETDLSCASLEFANLSGTIARRASFAGADLMSASLLYATVTDSDFRVQTLAGADLRRAVLQGSCLGNPESFYGATIDRMTLAGALVTSPAWLDIAAKQPNSIHGFQRAEWVIKCPRRLNFEPPRRSSFEPGWRPV